jgi:hypothetical protein
MICINQINRDIFLYGRKWKVGSEEYKLDPRYDFSYEVPMFLRDHQRIVGLIKDLSQLFEGSKNFISLYTSHGGYIPLSVVDYFTNIICLDDNKHISSNHSSNNVREAKIQKDLGCTEICFFKDEPAVLGDIMISENKRFELEGYQIFELWNSPNYTNNYYIYVLDKHTNLFTEKFKNYLDNRILRYDNLINLCMIVKDAGDILEKVLTENLEFIDKWTILDTGSKDNTISIIEKVLKNKNGKLYQEPFINFRDSRNRCLELAGDQCQYNIMLDDTYVLKGNIRDFLEKMRGNQKIDSFSIFIKSSDIEYLSNRIVESHKNLRYIYRIHEVIQFENNRNSYISRDICMIDDLDTPYMRYRSQKRKEYDLKILFEEYEETKHPRMIYCIAMTYSSMGKNKEAYDWYLKRFEYDGLVEEKKDALLQAARVAKELNKSWNEIENIYKKMIAYDGNRPEPYYHIGKHYYIMSDLDKAFTNFKKAWEIGFPQKLQFLSNPRISYTYVPNYLTELAYILGEFILAERVVDYYLKNNDSKSPNYEEMVQWKKNLEILNMVSLNKNCSNLKDDKDFKDLKNDKDKICIIYDKEFDDFIYRDYEILAEENIYIFSNKVEKKYYSFVLFPSFISFNKIELCIIYNNIEYLMTAINSSYIKNIVLFLTEKYITTMKKQFIPVSFKLQKIFVENENARSLFKSHLNQSITRDPYFPQYSIELY